MGIPKNIQSFLKPPASNMSPMQRLCRVLKGPGCYICGLCGKRYNNPNDAWKCLTSNGLSINSLPVIATKSNSQTYFCLLCGKTYANEPDTALCMIRDLQVARYPKVLGEHFNNLFYSLAEQSEKTKRDTLVSRQATLGNDLSKKQTAYNAPPPPVQKQPAKKIESKPSPDKGSGSDSDVIIAQESSMDDILEQAESSGDPMDHETDINQKPKEIEKPVLYRKPGQKPFARENAQYRCTVCNEKFFTKMEVETHFEEHPLVDSI